MYQGPTNPEDGKDCLLTWEGQELLELIRRRSKWARIRDIARKKGIDLSFEAVKILAKAVVEHPRLSDIDAALFHAMRPLEGGPFAFDSQWGHVIFRQRR